MARIERTYAYNKLKLHCPKTSLFVLLLAIPSVKKMVTHCLPLLIYYDRTLNVSETHLTTKVTTSSQRVFDKTFCFVGKFAFCILNYELVIYTCCRLPYYCRMRDVINHHLCGFQKNKKIDIIRLLIITGRGLHTNLTYDLQPSIMEENFHSSLRKREQRRIYIVRNSKVNSISLSNIQFSISDIPL